MTLAAALTRLATWSVTGVTTHYAYNAMPDGAIPESKLPALVVDFGEYGEIVPVNVALTSGTLDIQIDHWLLYQGYGLGLASERHSTLVTLTDNYMAKVITDMTLNANLADSLKIAPIQLGSFEYGGLIYRGILFRHVWKILY
jgi:hypothetical protein